MQPKIILPALLFFLFSISNSQLNNLELEINNIVKAKNALVGVSISGIENNISINYNADKIFPFQSVYKLHLAIVVLSEIDKGNLKLDQQIFIKQSDMIQNIWSPIREKYPNGNINLTIAEILEYTIAESDNIGADILFKLIGGPKIVNQFFTKVGIKNMQISSNEEEMQKKWENQFENWTTPKSACEVLKLAFNNNFLSENNYKFLWSVLAKTQTGKMRIKNSLPKGTIVAHKTGTSGTNDEGIMSAVNDIGIVTLPNGEHYAISVFITNSKEILSANEKIISDISKATWNYFTKN